MMEMEVVGGGGEGSSHSFVDYEEQAYAYQQQLIRQQRNQQSLQPSSKPQSNPSSNSSRKNGGSTLSVTLVNVGEAEEEEEEEEREEEWENEGEEEEDEDDYPNMLQFCEAQIDDGENDEEERGLPPVIPGNNYNYHDPSESGNGEGTRITTNKDGIRIVERVYPDERDDDGEVLNFSMQKGVRMNRPRKVRPEKLAGEAYLRQLQSDDYDNFRPNILARKLMGVSSQPLQRPPPLVQKPRSPGISLESILKQGVSVSPGRPKSASSLVLSQLKIKPNHIPLPNGNKGQGQRLLGQQGQNFSSPSKNPRSILAPKMGKSGGYQFQQTQSASLQSARTNGLGMRDQGQRLSIAQIQQQVKLQAQQAFQQQQQQQQQQQGQRQKNVPRCPICKRTFATQQVLQRHMALHAPPTPVPERIHKCEECLDEFESLSALNQHSLDEHLQLQAIPLLTSDPSAANGGAYRCRVCYRTFTCAETLKSHAIQHEGEFKCRACRRGFPDWASLEEHEATHKRYNCQWCEKYFMNSGNLKAHERIHTGERPYKCADCPKAFKQLGGLQYHLKTNPSHRPQKYHKGEVGEYQGQGSGGSGSGSGYEEFEEGDGILNMSLGALNSASN